MDFPCTKCGACCIIAGKLGLMPQREDGACIHLTKDNLCEIYEDRPEECVISDKFKENAQACNRLQKLLGIDKSYRVDTEIFNE